MSSTVSGPGHLSHRRPVGRAVDPWGVSLEDDLVLRNSSDEIPDCRTTFETVPFSAKRSAAEMTIA